MDVSKVKTKFGGKNLPKDEYFLTLYGKAYQHIIDCHMAVIPMDKIVPFSGYKPKVSSEYRKYFMDLFAKDKPPPMHVYEKDGHFVMSDDYNAYFMYKEVKNPVAICLVLGPTTIKDGVTYGPAFKLQPPSMVKLPK